MNTQIDFSFKIKLKISTKEIKFCTLLYKEIFIHIIKESFLFAAKICFYRLISPNKVRFRGLADLVVSVQIRHFLQKQTPNIFFSGNLHTAV